MQQIELGQDVAPAKIEIVHVELPCFVTAQERDGYGSGPVRSSA